MHVLKTLVNNQIFFNFFFFISGILKCFLSSVAHFTSFEIRQKNLPTATFQIKGQATGHAVVILKEKPS